MRHNLFPAVLVGLLVLSGCQQEMAKQPKYLPLAGSDFFGDGRSARPLVPGTIARGTLPTDEPEFVGIKTPAVTSGAPPTSFGTVGIGATAAELKKSYVDVFPFPITRAVLDRGQQRFTIYCSVCHGPLGNGDGVIVQRGFTRPPTYHSDRLREAPVGYLFNVATHGFGSMPAYASQVPPRDRWAIIAYIRALQLSQYAPLAELPRIERDEADAQLLQKGSDGGTGK